jgi:hypothetical protein
MSFEIEIIWAANYRLGSGAEMGLGLPTGFSFCVPVVILLLEPLAILLLPPGVFDPDGTFTGMPVGVDEADDDDDGPTPCTPTAPPPFVFGVPTPAATLVFRLGLLAWAIEPTLFFRLWSTEAGILLGWFILAGGMVAWVEVLLKRWCPTGEVTGSLVAGVSVGTVPPRACWLDSRGWADVGRSGTNSCGERTCVEL